MLTNSEFIILTFVFEQKKISGYKLNKLISGRGYKEGGSIGTTAIYNSLSKLSEKELITSTVDEHKKGRGPKGFLYEITEKGIRKLQKHVSEIIASYPVSDPKYYPALSALNILDTTNIMETLAKRLTTLQNGQDKIKLLISGDDEQSLDFNKQMVVRYQQQFNSIDREFTQRLLDEYTRFSHL